MDQRTYYPWMWCKRSSLFLPGWLTKLLDKCLHGYTQNQNEALNKEIWSLCPKTINVGARTIRTASALAVAISNNGWSAAERVAQRLHLPQAKWLARLVKSLDRERLRAAQYKALATTKKARKYVRRQKKKKNEELKHTCQVAFRHLPSFTYSLYYYFALFLCFLKV